MRTWLNDQVNLVWKNSDHLTKFVILRAFTSKRAAEVAHHLWIYSFSSVPAILQSDNGSEFTAQVIHEHKIVWPTLIMVHVKPPRAKVQWNEPMVTSRKCLLHG